MQVLSDAYVVLEWDDATLAAKLAPMAPTHRPPPGDASGDARRACIRLLSAALAWPAFRCTLVPAPFRAMLSKLSKAVRCCRLSPVCTPA